MEISHTTKRKKSKHKKNKHQVEVEQLQTEVTETLPTEEKDMSSSKKKHKLKKHRPEGQELGVGIQEYQCLEVQEQHSHTDNKSKKRKHKKKKLTGEQVENAGDIAILKEHKKRNNENETVNTDTQVAEKKGSTDDENTEAADETKLKKLKKRHAEVNPVEYQKVDDVESSKKAQKRKKMHNEDIEDNTTPFGSEQKSTKKKKHKKNKSKEEETSDSVSDLQASPAKKTEIESSPAENSGKDNVIQGQWQGSLFDNSDRQNKFLRLMGGMKAANQPNKATGLAGTIKKKGLFGSLVPSTVVSGNAALSASAAADLNHKLEMEYDKAMNFKLTAKKGSGFGFTPDPAEGKKFHIDVFKTNSIQFDD